MKPIRVIRKILSSVNTLNKPLIEHGKLSAKLNFHA